MAIFNTRLKELREQAGMTQEAVARAANLSSSTIAKLEQSDISPTWDTLQAIAKALGVDCKAFEGEVKPAPKKGMAKEGITDAAKPKEKGKGK
jgi:transcriptional regulator with XRE-family HTH domain